MKRKSNGTCANNKKEQPQDYGAGDSNDDDNDDVDHGADDDDNDVDVEGDYDGDNDDKADVMAMVRLWLLMNLIRKQNGETPKSREEWEKN